MMNILNMPNRSKNFIFIPFCLECQAAQAQKICKYSWKSSITPIMQFLIDNDVNIIQMPCPEWKYKGLIRNPAGLKTYDTEDFNNICEQLAEQTSQQIEEIIAAKYRILGILGIEMSPSCAVNYIYTNEGMKHRKGIFFEHLEKKTNTYKINFIGINRRNIKRTINVLTNIMK